MAGELTAEFPTTGIMWFMRGRCTQCGKLTPPAFADPNDDDMEGLARLRDMAASAGWYVDVYRLFSGPKPGINCIFRCKMCDKELRQLANKGKSETTTIVTSLGKTQAETAKGVT